ncbi:MAG TPA: S26 family signal peptidase [Streptosporangiaceae bacterium]|jgi:signal peptidase I
MILAAAGAAIAVAAAVPVAIWLLRRRIAIVSVFGPSMRPTLRTGDRVLVRRAGLDDLRRGLIVVVEQPAGDGTWSTPSVRWPADSRAWLIKRLAALPGDPWPASISPGSAERSPVVPAGQLVVLGDNADWSLDSRKLGCIPAERLLGVMLRPLNRR